MKIQVTYFSKTRIAAALLPLTLFSCQSREHQHSEQAQKIESLEKRLQQIEATLDFKSQDSDTSFESSAGLLMKEKSHSPPPSPASAPSLPESKSGPSPAAEIKAAPAETPPSQETQFHLVKANESWDTLALKYQISKKELLKLNPKASPENIRMGQFVNVPVEAPSAPKEASTETEKTRLTQKRDSTQTAQKKPAIEKKFSLPSSLEEATAKTPKIKSSKIAAPKLDGNSSIHTVKSGETMSAISRRYKVPLTRLLKENPKIKPRFLSVGTQVKIPQNSQKSASSDSTASPVNDGAKTIIQLSSAKTVQEVAELNQVSIESINKWNRLNLSKDQTLPPGTTLVIKK